MITKELLESKIAEMQQTIAIHNGAIQFAEYLLSVIAETPADEMTLDDFAQAVGGNGASAEILPVGETK